MSRFSLAVLQADQPEIALPLLDIAGALNAFNPVIRMVRAPLYAEAGRIGEATADALWLSLSDDPVVLQYAAPLQAAYPLDPSTVETWTVYPVYSTSGGVGGSYNSDLTSMPPRPSISLSTFEDGLLAQGIASMLGEEPNGADVIFLRESDENRYEFSTADAEGVDPFFENSFALIFNFNGEWFNVDWSQYYFEGAYFANYFVTPADIAADPRSGFNGADVRCGDMLPVYRPGMQIYAYNFDGQPVFDQPNGTPLEPLFQMGQILTVGDCIDGILWLEIETIDSITEAIGPTGWIQSNDDTGLYLWTIADHSLLGFYCPDTLPVRLVIGLEGEVIIGQGANNLRREASTESDLLTAIPEGERFNVVGGPACGEGLVWWQVEYNGFTGWTPEGEGDTYWLNPIFER
jgi:hypothetical protein